MKKEYVIFIGAGILLLLVIGSGYQFYLKPTAEKLIRRRRNTAATIRNSWIWKNGTGAMCRKTWCLRGCSN